MKNLKLFFVSLLRGFGRDRRGSAVVMTAFMSIAFLGVAGLAIDGGHIYLTQNMLQAATRSASLAAARSMVGQSSNSAALTAATTTATNWIKNYEKNIPGVSSTPTVAVGCTTSPCNSSSIVNAVKVTETVSVSTYFLRVLDLVGGSHDSVTISTTAYASTTGASLLVDTPVTGGGGGGGGGGGSGSSLPTPQALYVMFVLDTTGSMGNSDPSPSTGCTSTKIACARLGIQGMLGALQQGVDNVGLMVFPGFSASATGHTAAQYCSGVSLTKVAYNNASIHYDIVALGNTASTYTELLDAVGGNGCSGTPSTSNLGGEGTYYAGVITAAQNALTTAASGTPNSIKVLVLLSDGDSNASSSSGEISSTLQTNQCHQAITNAVTASSLPKPNNILVYSVAYESAASGCAYDSPKIVPCQVMYQIASSAATFFEDAATASNAGCPVSTGNGYNVTGLAAAFAAIASTLKPPALISSSTFKSYSG